MRKIVYNTCYGGFGISQEAADEMVRRGHRGVEAALAQQKEYGCLDDVYIDDFVSRTDPVLVAVVEELGERANGGSARLRIEEFEDDEHFLIEDHDGKERLEFTGRCDCCSRPRRVVP